MSEQFGAIPVRAFSDTRLSAADFRVMGAIAYFDRLGRNGAGCFADPRKIAELANVDYTHINRHTRRLQVFGYLEIRRSAADRRKRVYSLIYNEDQAVVANSGDNPDSEDTGSEPDDNNGEIVANSGYDPPEKVAEPISQAVDPQAKSRPKRLSEAYIKNPAKRRRAGDGAKSPDAGELADKVARQGGRGGAGGWVQREILYPMQGGYQKPTRQRSEPDWNGWVAWRVITFRETKEEALNFIGGGLDRIKDERGIDLTEAGVILDREFKRQRKLAS